MDATDLSVSACRELARRLTEWTVLQTHDHAADLCPLAAQDVRFISAIRAAAEAVGRPPTTTEYQDDYKRRLGVGEDGLPSLSSILKHFDGWPYALAAAGLEPAVAPRGIQRRRPYQRKRVHRYRDERLAKCLLACEEDLGRIPMVRDYVAWREEELGGRPGRRPPDQTVPHYRSYYNRYGSWGAALAASGLDGSRGARVSTPARPGVRS